jgi:hypothetical protein
MVSRFFTDNIVVYRAVKSTGLGGEKINTYTSYIDVIGSFQNLGGSKSAVNDIDAYRKNKVFFCDIVDVKEKDRIYYDGKFYNIMDAPKIWGHHMELSLEIKST